MLSEHDSLYQAQHHTSEHEFSAICNFERAVSNLYACGFPDVVSELVQDRVIALLTDDLEKINESKATAERDYKKIREKYVAKMTSNNAVANINYT